MQYRIDTVITRSWPTVTPDNDFDPPVLERTLHTFPCSWIPGAQFGIDRESLRNPAIPTSSENGLQVQHLGTQNAQWQRIGVVFDQHCHVPARHPAVEHPPPGTLDDIDDAGGNDVEPITTHRAAGAKSRARQ